jgi:hypothetical protein
MKLTLLPLQEDEMIRVRSEGPLTGDRDGGNALEALLGPRCYSHSVLLDLERSPSVTTSGIGWLITCSRQFSKAGGRLVMYNVPPQVLDVLNFACVAPLLLIAPREQAAFELARKSGSVMRPPAATS